MGCGDTRASGIDRNYITAVTRSSPGRRRLGAMSPTPDARVGAAVAAVLEQRNGVVAELVSRSIDLELRRLVELELAARTPATADTASATPTAKVCRVCGKQEPDARFDPGRRQCRSCRGARYSRHRGERVSAASGAVLPANEERRPPRSIRPPPAHARAIGTPPQSRPRRIREQTLSRARARDRHLPQRGADVALGTRRNAVQPAA
jgi:hypothetical protein